MSNTKKILTNRILHTSGVIEAKVEQKLKEYAERFNENFPIFLFRNLPEEDIIKAINDCLASNKLFEGFKDLGNGFN